MKHQKSPHLLLAHHFWKNHLRPGDCAIDATCGNGHDTLFLAKLLFPHPESFLAGIDLQAPALENTRQLIKENFTEELSRIYLMQGCHSDFNSLPLPKKPRLIVYNLGYLPGGDKSITTETESTLKSLQNALSLLPSDGALSITCYPGHSEGAREETAVFEWAKNLNPAQWRVFSYQTLNRPSAPSLLWISIP